jgi:hypothetical protein
MNQTGKVFVACFLGALIGAFVALQVNHNSWWVGLIVGFATGYLSFEFKKVVSAAPQAWQAASTWRWQPNREWWRWYPMACLAAASYLSIVTFPIFILAVIARNTLMIIGTLVTTLAMSALFAGELIEWDSPAYTQMKITRELRFNFINIYFWIVPKYLLKGAWWMIAGIPTVARVVWNFFRYFFRLIHSDIRLLCGTDAAIGACIGYFSHSALIGAIAGGMLGVLNFEIISIRVLKLVPATNSIFRR